MHSMQPSMPKTFSFSLSIRWARMALHAHHTSAEAFMMVARAADMQVWAM